MAKKRAHFGQNDQIGDRFLVLEAFKKYLFFAKKQAKNSKNRKKYTDFKKNHRFEIEKSSIFYSFLELVSFGLWGFNTVLGQNRHFLT